jgi:hypothetical protein
MMFDAIRHCPMLVLAALVAWHSTLKAQESPATKAPAKAPQGRVTPLNSPPERSDSTIAPVRPRERTLPLPKPGEKLPEQPANEQIAALVRNLDADEFLERETAMLQLLEAGPAVLPALRPVLTGGSLEATSRAFFVVRQVGLAADADAQDQAGQLLAELAQRTEAPTLARRAAAALAEMTQQRSAHALEELEALGAKVTRSELAAVLPFDDPAMSLEIGDAFTGTEDDLRRLKWVVAAPQLVLSGKKATDRWLAHAAAMPSLEELHLYQAAVSDEGIAALAENTTLRQLGIYYTQVGDAALSPLGKLPLLSFIKLYGTKVSEEAVAKYKDATGVTVDFRRGAFLGVGCQDPESCRISTVHADSPAAKGGLLRDDVIVRFAGHEVKNFETLTDLIRKCDVGDEIDIQVARPILNDQGNLTLKKITARLTLAPWELEPAVRNARR